MLHWFLSIYIFLHFQQQFKSRWGVDLKKIQELKAVSFSFLFILHPQMLNYSLDIAGIDQKSILYVGCYELNSSHLNNFLRDQDWFLCSLQLKELKKKQKTNLMRLTMWTKYQNNQKSVFIYISLLFCFKWWIFFLNIPKCKELIFITMKLPIIVMRGCNQFITDMR